jgi:Flp pilus assembly protein TadG
LSILARQKRIQTINREDGQATVEMLVVFPSFMLVILFVIYFALAMYSYVSVANGVREGARFGAVGCETGDCTGADPTGTCSTGTDDAIKGRAVNRSSGVLDCTDITVTWGDDAGNGNRDRGNSVKVDVPNHSFTFISSLFPSFPVKSCATMRLELDQVGSSSGTASC